MKQNVAFPIGNVALIDKIDCETNFFNSVFGGLGGRAKSFISAIKLLANNRLGACLSINRIPEFTPEELFKLLGFQKPAAARTLNRTLERIGEKHQLVLQNYQGWIGGLELVDKTQFIDFTSAYFEGKESPLGELGYSRDGQPGKLQLTIGISVGINGIPTALTIQKGNVQDKKHMKSMIRICSNVLPENSVLIFDCGGNTKKNKEKIRKLGFHYLTLKAKKKTPYRKAIRFFNSQTPQKIQIGDRKYLCVKRKDGEETQYIFFSKKLKRDHLRKKDGKFRKALEKGAGLEKKVKKGKDLGQHVCPDGWIVTKGDLQRTLTKIQNPFITGLEGFFILESSIDANPAEILKLYKDRDKAEKFIRDLKEGAEMRPIRHWSKNAVIGSVLLVFLTNALVNLTHLLAKNPLVRNLKVLKKYLTNLTLTLIYPKNGLRIAAISNFSAEMRALLGDFVLRYGDLEPQIYA